ncbi:MAG: 3-isopropylmalate dehydrogenase [Trueperaceae bacterium]|nr:3-isopropylmalate dehydrogenase [Trueperaceae bacterium]
MKNYNLAVLPGDFIGPEVVDATIEVLEALSPQYNLKFTYNRLPFGGNALESHGHPLPEETKEACSQADAVLMGSAGGPVGDHPWNKVPREKRVESGILGIRKHLGLYANLRPVKVFEGLEHLSPLKTDVARGTDMLIIRELTGGIYFGKPSFNEKDKGLSTMVYERYEVERIARTAFESATLRGGKVTSVDKANVLDVSQFWRDVVVGIHQSEFPQIELDHLYVDNAAMQIASKPTQFDTVVTSNLFGDILSDLAAVIPGSLGVLPSASLGGTVGLFEPVHGSAPDIAGQGIANPVGTLLSAAMMLRFGLKEVDAADAVEKAVQAALAEDATKDLGGTRGTKAFTDAVIQVLPTAAAV